MRTINDINNANKAMWDSGEMVHGAADTRHPPAGGQELHKGKQVVTSHDEEDASSEVVIGHSVGGRPYKARIGPILTTLSGGRPSKEEIRINRQMEAASHDDTPRRQVHLPRNAGRRWRGSSWDGTDTSTVIEDGAEEKAALEKVNSLRAQETPIHLQNKEQREGSRKLHSVAAYLATGKKLTPEQKKHI